MTQFDTENKDVLLAMALAAGTGASDAARQTGLSLSTVNRRTADPDFRRLVANPRGEMLRSALGHITDKMTRAADTRDPAIRIRAARAVVTLGSRLHDARDVTERVRALEGELARREDVP